MESVSIIDLLIATFLLYLPAYIANMSPPIARALHLPGGMPLSARFLGQNKTWRGMYTGVIAGAGGGLLLQSLSLSWFGAATLSYALLAGALMGGGALVGDAVKSAIKRWCAVPSGRPFVPWDQWDFILGATLFVLPLIPIPWRMFFTALLITPLLHLMVNILAYECGFKDVWW